MIFCVDMAAKNYQHENEAVQKNCQICDDFRGDFIHRDENALPKHVFLCIICDLGCCCQINKIKTLFVLFRLERVTVDTCSK